MEFITGMISVSNSFLLQLLAKVRHYSEYLHINEILSSQFPESDKKGTPAHDEMLFIIIHQTYELWFKQLLHETNSIIDIMQKPALNDNSPELQTVVHRLARMVTI